MTYTRDPWGNEVDEQGFLRTAVEGWARHGIAPPPLMGDPNNPEHVRMVKETRARMEGMSEDERGALRVRQQEFIRRWDAEHPELAALLPAHLKIS